MRYTLRLLLLLVLGITTFTSCEDEELVEEPAYYPGKIVFSSTREGIFNIYIMNGDGTGVRNLIKNQNLNCHNPQFSPDGLKIVFEAKTWPYRAWPNDTDWDIYIIDADGGIYRRLTRNGWNNLQPRFSPDGTKIVWQVRVGNGRFEIFSMEIDGSNQVNLTNTPDYDGDEASPQYSPDGSKILFLSRASSGGGLDISIMDADGGNVMQLAFMGPESQVSILGLPQFSPDGFKIAYASFIDTDSTFSQDIHLMNTDGSNKINLTNNMAINFNPQFSSDGSEIAFSSHVDSKEDIYIMDLDGSNERRLTNTGKEFNSLFSPVGSWIMFMSWRVSDMEIYLMNSDGSGQTNLDIILMNSDGSGQTNLTRHDGKDQDPQFQPLP